jgi:hypothetical protein
MMDAFSRIAEWVQYIGYALLFLSVAPLFPFLYVVLRWRAEGRREPGAGTYGALLYFCTVSSLLALAGAANLTYGALSTTPVDERLNRLSWGMLAGSLAFLALNGGLLLRLKARAAPPDARRVFLGFFTVLAGLVAFAALVMFCVTAFERVEPARADLHADDLKLYASWAAYFTATYLLAMARLSKAMTACAGSPSS